MINKSGIIYMISHNNLFYIGSTTKTIEERLSNHIRNYKHFLKKEINFTTVYKILELCKTPKIEILEKVIIRNKDDLRNREKYYIQLFYDKIVNKNIPNRKYKEYYRDNIIQVKLKNNTYYNNNKEKRKEQMKQHYLKNKEKKNKYCKLYYTINKEQLSNINKQKYQFSKSINYLNKISLDLFE
jgi:ferredoxin-thioredoxin reductase catalytic subunit